ncbi:MAG: FlgD immunoglobulin-like domain containing protein [Bacteroidota bacterium]
MNRPLLLSLLVPFFALPQSTGAQDFDAGPVPYTPGNLVEYKLDQPISHLDVNNYKPSTTAVFAGFPSVFRLHLRHQEWSNGGVFMQMRWDQDLDESNGIQWSDWEGNSTVGYFRTVEALFPAPGRRVLRFELRLSNSAGQNYSRQKRSEITVAPPPALVYGDSRNNRLFFFPGADAVLDRPILMVEGFDPDNSNTPEVNYALGFDLIEEARAAGYDVFIIEFASGGVDLKENRDVFLGACRFIRSLIQGREGAVQVVGISMGGTIARMGLAWAEDNSPVTHGGQRIEHYVSTFISFDAPQQGAHLNTEFQEFVRTNGTPLQKSILESRSARQMLYDNVFGGEHDQLYDYLAGLHNQDPLYGYTHGYPRRCVNYSVSNGNHQADYPHLTTQDDLATIRIYVTVDAANLLTIPALETAVHIPAQSRDLWPGSTFPDDLTTLHAYGTQYFGGRYIGPLWTRAYGTWRFQVNFNPSYTPTESALDLYGYGRTADGSLIGGTSRFDGTLEQISFRRHEELTMESRIQVMGWLNQNASRPYLGCPSSPAASQIPGEAVVITWGDESAHEEGFRIERKDSGGTFQLAGIAPRGATGFRDPAAGLIPFRTYTYRVSSFAGSASSPAGGEVSVTVQPRLASDNASATSGAGQRKVASFGNATHAVYVSQDRIWYARNEGSGWLPEIPISGGATGCTHPSLAVHRPGGYPVVHVVWEFADEFLGTPCRSVLYRRSTDGGITWGAITPLVDPDYAYATRGTDARPAVVASYDRAAACWTFRGDAGWGGIALRMEPADPASPTRILQGTDATAEGVSLDGLAGFKVAWTQGTGAVYFREFSAGGPPDYPLAYIGQRIEVSQPLWMTGCRNPSIAGTGGAGTLLAWDGVDLLQDTEEEESSPAETVRRCVFLRERSAAGIWQPVRRFSSPGGSDEHPSVGADARVGVERVHLLWKAPQGVAYAYRELRGTSWSSPGLLGPGTGPHVCSYVYGTLRPYALWTGAAPFPYGIRLRDLTPDLTAEEMSPENRGEADLQAETEGGSCGGMIAVRSSRFVVVSGAGRRVLPFVHHTASFGEWLGVPPFRVRPSDDSLIGSARITVRNFSTRPGYPSRRPLWRVELTSGRRIERVRNLTVGDLVRLGATDTSFLVRYAIPLRSMTGEAVGIRQSLLGEGFPQEPTWTEILNGPTGAPPEAGPQGKNPPRVPEGTPPGFRLLGCYPNPFNSSTRIAVDIPGEGCITVTIRDILGRSVATLATGHVGAGRHTLEWSGRTTEGGPLPSGLYLADVRSG